MSVNTKVNGQLVRSAGLYSISTPIGMADIYSTEEKEVGLWIDGKPLYQKSIKLDDVTVPQSGRVLIGLGTYISNIDNVIGGEVIVIDGSTNLVLPAFQIATMSQYGLTYTINKADGIVISRGSDSGAVTRDFIATVRYTKTTDIPWSGKFVPQGYGYVSSGDIYSLEERQVGVWHNGKPLYQKTVDCGALPNNTTKTIAHGVSDIDYISSIKGTAYSSTNGFTLTLEDIDAQAGINYAIRLYANATDIYLFTKSNQSMYDTCFVTIQYTKTTDVAGSGEYVPSGDKAVHYSANEEVIGTWFGETLYRKSFVFESSVTVSYQTFTDTGFSVSNINKIVFGYLYRQANAGLIGGDFSVVNTNHIGARVLAGFNLECGAGSVLTIEYTKSSS